MFVNKLPFFVTMSRNIKFSKAQLPDCWYKAASLIDAMKQESQSRPPTWSTACFKTDMCLMDGQFEPIQQGNSKMTITMNTVAKGEHNLPEVEQQIQTINERVHCVYNTLPFTKNVWACTRIP